MSAEKPIDKAVAIVYDRSRASAPQVVASGRGEVAARIIALAEEAGVMVRQDPDLLELLAKVPVGREIPLELYKAVAEVLAFVYQVNGRYKERG